jgi:hypothetical protein
MDINEKIQKVKEYVAKLEGTRDDKELRNDAANIFADSCEDYQAILDALQEVPCEIEMVDNVPGQVIQPMVIPEVVIPEDFSI